MLDRLIALFQAILNALLGHADNPADMLEQTYEELQQTLIRVRQDLAVAIAKEEQFRQTGSPELALQEMIVSKLRERVEELEKGVLSAYTKKQMLIARNKAAMGSDLPVSKGLMTFFVGAISVWLLISLGFLIAHLLH